MPIHTGQDKNGKFYQWGKTGKKYYFKPGDEASRKRARGKAEAQQTAIYSNGWKGDNETKMKLVKVKKKADIQYSPKTKQQADVVYQHLLVEYRHFTKHLRELSELVHLLQGVDTESRQQLARNMVSMANSMEGPWNGITSRYQRL